MPRRVPKSTRNNVKLRRRGSRKRYRSSSQFLHRVPVRRNQKLDVVIGDVGSRGDGIAIVHGYQIYVPGSKMGERLRIRIVSVGGKFATAEKIVTPIDTDKESQTSEERKKTKNEVAAEETKQPKP
ncbi:MAG: TRAM domain-containing protein [Candidatus Bathyarchaeota archaeon]|jgi:predicted RNA-binding protein with TRAM domain